MGYAFGESLLTYHGSASLTDEATKSFSLISSYKSGKVLHAGYIMI